MDLRTDENGKLEPIVVMAVNTMANLPPKNDNKTDKQKISVIGAQPLLSGKDLVVWKIVDGAPAGLEKDVFISVVNQPVGGIELQKSYKLSGRIYIKHYAVERLGCVIEAESMVPLKGAGSQSKSE